MNRIIHSLTRRVPPSLVRAVGRAQSRNAVVRDLIRAATPALTQGEGTIARGPGEGLRFDATGGYPGYLLGTSEPEEQEALATHLRPGMTFFDIGANIGFFSTLAGRLVGPGGRVIAFEPFPESAQRAGRNAQLNGFDHVSVVEAAVGASMGTVGLQLRESATHKVVGPSTGSSLVVEQIAIDEWRANSDVPPPDVVMIDVEGAELDVLLGMKETIAAAHPLILCEVHWLGQDFPSFVDAELAPLGYTARTLDGQPVRDEGRWHALLEPANQGRP
jgi:FkbM family methyltransferase